MDPTDEGIDTTGYDERSARTTRAAPGPSVPVGPTSLALTSRQIAAATAFPRLPLPIISENNIDGYFFSMEFWFKASGIIDDIRKYNTVLGQVLPGKLMDLKTIIESTPASNKYAYIRDKLLEHFADSLLPGIAAKSNNSFHQTCAPANSYFYATTASSQAIADLAMAHTKSSINQTN